MTATKKIPENCFIDTQRFTNPFFHSKTTRFKSEP